MCRSQPSSSAGWQCLHAPWGCRARSRTVLTCIAAPLTGKHARDYPSELYSMRMQFVSNAVLAICGASSLVSHFVTCCRVASSGAAPVMLLDTSAGDKQLPWTMLRQAHTLTFPHMHYRCQILVIFTMPKPKTRYNEPLRAGRCCHIHFSCAHMSTSLLWSP